MLFAQATFNTRKWCGRPGKIKKQLLGLASGGYALKALWKAMGFCRALLRAI